MQDTYIDFVNALDIDTLQYDTPPLKYHNPRHKGRPELRTLTEMGFPYDVNDMSHYYNSEAVREFNEKTRQHWKRKLPLFENRYMQYLLTLQSREEAFAAFYADCEPYGVSETEAEQFLRLLMVYQLEPAVALEVVKEFIFLILEYAPKSFDYFISCFGIYNGFVYKELYRTAYEILELKMKDFAPAPRILQREILKGTPLVEIYCRQYENKSAIKEALKALSREELDRSPLSYELRKVETILFSQSNPDYTINEQRGDRTFPFCIYDSGNFLFAIVCEDSLIIDEDHPEEFEVQLEPIKAMDIQYLQKGIPLYHIDTFRIDEDDNFEYAVADDLRRIRKDICYLYDMIRNGKQFAYIVEYLAELDDYEDYEY